MVVMEGVAMFGVRHLKSDFRGLWLKVRKLGANKSLDRSRATRIPAAKGVLRNTVPYAAESLKAHPGDSTGALSLGSVTNIRMNTALKIGRGRVWEGRYDR